jgi:RNA polymerase sigma-70 factor (ECF subfamily)
MHQSDLLASFRAHLEDRSLDPAGERGLGAVLDARWHEARAAWPGVEVDRETFMAHLAHRVPPHEELKTFLDRAYVPDLYLCCGCLQKDPVAVERFEHHVWSDADLAVRCMEIDPSLAEEVKQDLRCSLLVGDAQHPPRLALYSGLGSLGSWLKVVAVRAVQQALRTRRRQRIDDGDQLELIADPEKDQELAYLKRLYHTEFSGAFRRALASLGDRERNLLVHRHVEGLNIDQIGEIYGVHRATAARWISAARLTLLEGTRQEMNRALKLQGSEVDSIIWLIESQMPRIIREHLTPAAETEDEGLT